MENIGNQSLFYRLRSILMWLFINSDTNENINFLPLYYKRLRSTYERLSINSDSDKKNQSKKEEIEILFKENESWEIGNKIERMMVFIMDDTDLDFEIKQKLLSSEYYFDNENIALYKEVGITGTENSNIKKKYLLHLIQDIQWQIGQRELLKPAVDKAKHIIKLCMWISIVFLLIAQFPVYLNIYFPVVMSAGFMGAVFSMLTGISKQSNKLIVNDLQNLYSKETVVLRMSLGVAAALLAYYFFQSEMFNFTLFPDINQLEQYANWKQCIISERDEIIKGMGDVCKKIGSNNSEAVKFCKTLMGDISKIDDNVIRKVSAEICEKNNNEVGKWEANLYKLIIMSFLAGFSEKLVPNMLNKTKTKINNDV